MPNTNRASARTTATRPPRPKPESDFDAEPTPADAQEAEALGHFITVALAGEEVRVVPAPAWRVSSQRALRAGDLDGFMEGVLHEDDYELYVDIDPTQDEFAEFVEACHAASGESQGKSRGSSKSSRRTRRR